MSEQNPSPDISADADTEGHGRRPRGGTEDAGDDTEGHRHWVRSVPEDADDDTEGHLKRRETGDADDTEGHFHK